MISEQMIIVKVRIPITNPTYSDPSHRPALVPTTPDPMMLAMLLQMVLVLIKDSLSFITLLNAQDPKTLFLQADLTSALESEATAISHALWMAEAMIVMKKADSVLTMWFSVWGVRG
jgi:hypothetical protein